MGSCVPAAQGWAGRPGGQGDCQLGGGAKRNQVSVPPLKNLRVGRATGHGAGCKTSLALAGPGPRRLSHPCGEAV